jgi:hypothetical protein
VTTNREEMAGQVRRAMASQDIAVFSQLLDSEVTWGVDARNPSCKNRRQVLAWYQRGRDAGVSGSVNEIEICGDSLLVHLVVRGTESAEERGGAALRRRPRFLRAAAGAEIADVCARRAIDRHGLRGCTWFALSGVTPGANR